MKAPDFWWGRPGIRSFLLAPLGWVIGAKTAARMHRRGDEPPIPVVCIGNFVVGGAGKTPTAIALSRVVRAAGMKPCFLTRGYGGSLKGPLVADRMTHSASMIGDEALLLARWAPTIVSRYRPEAYDLLATIGADICIMDDGFQNPSVVKTLSLVVVDGAVGIGNGRCMPAGPLRAPFAAQLPFADAVVVLGGGKGAVPTIRAAARAGKPVIRAELAQRGLDVFAGRKVLAYAGIGRPDKFFDQLRDGGVDVVETRAFPDHHPYTGLEAREIMTAADRLGAALVTTEKDAVRLAHAAAGPRAELASRSVAVGVDCVFENDDQVAGMIKAARHTWILSR